MEIKRKVYKINIYGQQFELNKPKATALAGYTERIDAAGDDLRKSIEVQVDLLKNCGLTDEIINELDTEDFAAVAEFIVKKKQD